MSNAIRGNMVGAYSLMGKTFIIEDENSNSITGVVTDKEVVFTATDNDVRENMVYASENGISTGTKVIPSYHTREGVKLVTAGNKFEITSLQQLDLYKFTKLQAIICDFNTKVSDSVAANKVSINGSVYEVQSTVPLATVVANETDKTIDLGITNETDKMQILKYFTYKEIN